MVLKFIYSEKATKFCKIFPLLLTAVHTVKSKGKISQNFVAFSEYVNFTMFSVSKARWARRNEKLTNYYVIFLYFRCQKQPKTKLPKWDETLNSEINQL